MSWRDTKRQARQLVHATMRLPCWRVSYDGTVTAVHARLHVARANVTNDYAGDLLSLGYTERANETPKLIFFMPEVVPVAKDIYLFQNDEAYGVEAVRPSDDQYVSADCYRATVGQIDKSLAALVPAERDKIVFPIPSEV